MGLQGSIYENDNSQSLLYDGFIKNGVIMNTLTPIIN